MPCEFKLCKPGLTLDVFHHQRDYKLNEGCQFNVSENELVMFDGKTWCPYHLPTESKDKTESSAKKYWSTNEVENFNCLIFELLTNAKKNRLPCDLSGVVFPSKIRFEDYRSENRMPPLLLFRAFFNDRVDFIQVDFEEVCFFDVNFNKQVIFAFVNFMEEATFEYSKVEWFAKFDKVKFEGHSADFSKVQFRNDVFFYDVDVRKICNIKFTDVRFNTVYFKGSVFHGDANFRNTIFEGSGDFRNTFYGGEADFSNSIFKEDANFENASFQGDMIFNNTSFNGKVDFSCTVAESTEPSSIQRERFIKPVFFHDAKFNKNANFINRKFLNKTDFSGGFFQVAPEFYGCEFHHGTSFSYRVFCDRVGINGVDAELAYRTLKLKMGELRAKMEEERFFAYEQQSMRNNQHGISIERTFSLMYELFSDYGLSLSRPLIWLTGVLLFFFLIYLFGLTDFMISIKACFGNYENCNFTDEIKKAIYITFQQEFRPFTAYNVKHSALDVSSQSFSISWWMALIQALQSLLSLSLITLFILALRKRFRLR